MQKSSVQYVFRQLVITITLLCCTVLPASTQDSDLKKPFDIGFEAQAYPTGFILGTRFEKAITLRDALSIRLGYNFVYHRDLGVHEDERGGGAGFTIGYRHYFKDLTQGFFLGGRNDFWFNTINWKDSIGFKDEISGTTEIVVVQPTLEGGYLFVTKNEFWAFAPAVAFGFEINVNQKGEDVGEGAILLVGISASYRF